MTPAVPLVALAICVEVGATLSLKMATMRGPRWLPWRSSGTSVRLLR
jgi:multidrug transporter EmrE-like cation transporter